MEKERTVMMFIRNCCFETVAVHHNISNLSLVLANKKIIQTLTFNTTFRPLKVWFLRVVMLANHKISQLT